MQKWEQEYQENPKVLAWVFYPLFLLATILAGIFIQWQEPEALTYTLLAFVSLAFIAVYRANPKGFISIQTFGEVKNMLLAALIGGVFALVAPLLGLSIGVPLSIITTVSLRVLYQIISASLIEETFFRYIMFPSFKRWFGSAHASAILQAMAFGGYHLVFFKGDPTSIGVAVIIGYLLAIGNQYFKSGMLSLVFHIINNTRKLMLVG